MIKRLFTWGGVAFLIFFMTMRPAAAAEVVRSIGGGIIDVMSGFGAFFESLVA